MIEFGSQYPIVQRLIFLFFNPLIFIPNVYSAGDNKCDQESMNETFFLSNILPQNYENNANFWYRMEVFCRNLTKQFSDVYVISGPLWLPCQQDGKKIVQYEVQKCTRNISRLH